MPIPNSGLIFSMPPDGEGRRKAVEEMGLRPGGFWRWPRFTKARAGPRRRGEGLAG